MSRERFAMDEQSTFDYLYAEKRNDAEIGQKINVALNHIEEHNSESYAMYSGPLTLTPKWILVNPKRRTLPA